MLKFGTIVKLIAKLALLLFLLISREYEWWGSYTLVHFKNSSVFVAIYNFLIFWLSINILLRLNQFIYRKRKKLGDKYSDNVIVGLQNIYLILTGLGLIVMFLGMLGIEFTKLLTALSIVAAAIAIISKELVSDMITGFIISFSKDLAIGDYVKISNFKGKVLDINIYKIVILTENEELVFIPNSKAYFSEIFNFTRKATNQIRLDFSVKTDLHLKPDVILTKINNFLQSHKEDLLLPNADLFISMISKDEVRYQLIYYLKEYNSDLAHDLNSEIYSIVLNLIQNNDYLN